MNTTKILLALERSKLRTALLFSIFYSSSFFLFAQSPMSIPYQAVLRNADGSVMANAALTLTFKIHDVTATGAIVYHETHSLSSNAQGLVVCAVGNGTIVQGTFDGIQWGSGAKFMQVLMNPGSGEIDLGTQQLMSVPYALYSNGVHVHVSATGDTLTIGGSSIVVPGISAANVNNNTIPTSGLGSVVLPGNATCANEFISVTGCAGQTSLDYDGRTYDLVEIGGQCWFADNLATDQYRNGELISSAWGLSQPAVFNLIWNSEQVVAATDSIYGKWYNWYTTVDPRGICPSGWHVPTDCEWMYLEGAIGMSFQEQESTGWRGTYSGNLKSLEYWRPPNTGATNITGFSALPGGMVTWEPAVSTYLDTDGYYWSSTMSWYRGFDAYTSAISRYNDNGMIPPYTPNNGRRVRCVKD